MAVRRRDTGESEDAVIESMLADSNPESEHRSIGLKTTTRRYRQGTDLSWLWGWGYRLEKADEDNYEPSEYSGAVYYPCRGASRAMLAFSNEFPYAINKIEAHLKGLENCWREYLTSDDERDREAVFMAIERLYDTIYTSCVAISEKYPEQIASDTVFKSKIRTKQDLFDEEENEANHPNGPGVAGCWWWNGKRHEWGNCKAYKCARALWNATHKKLDLLDLAMVVEDHDEAEAILVSKSAASKWASGAYAYFKSQEIPLKISRKQEVYGISEIVNES